MHPSVMHWFDRVGTPADFKDRFVLEVGSLDVNGTVRPTVEAMGPKQYCGVDMRGGKGVDLCLFAEQLLDTFSPDTFDVVISTEMLEHAQDWRGAIANMKAVLKPGGTIFLTCRGPGFPLHDYPGDFWRFTTEDMAMIFADFVVHSLEADPECPGVFLKASKPEIRQPGVSLEAIDVMPMH